MQPELVKKCYDSVCRNKPDGYEIILLSMKNMSEYIILSKAVQEKYEKGEYHGDASVRYFTS